MASKSKRYKNRLTSSHVAKLTEWVILNRFKLENEPHEVAQLCRDISEELQLTGDEGEIKDISPTSLKSILEGLGITLRLSEASSGRSDSQYIRYLRERVTVLEDVCEILAEGLKYIDKEFDVLDNRQRSFLGRHLSTLRKDKDSSED